MTGFPRSAHARYGRKGRPLYPGTGGARAGRVQSPARRLPHHSGLALYPGTAITYPGLDLTRHQSRVHVIRPPGLPLTRGPPVTGDFSGFSLGSAPAQTGPAHARQGGDRLRAQARNYAAGLHASPPICEFTRIVCDLASHLHASVVPPWS
jgi:hypothetical protein